MAAPGSRSDDGDGDGSGIPSGAGIRRRCSDEGAAAEAVNGRFTAMASSDSCLANCSMSNDTGWLSSRPQPAPEPEPEPEPAPDLGPKPGGRGIWWDGRQIRV